MLRQVENRAEMKKWIDGYDTGIHYVDFHIGKIVARLRQLGVYDDTAIIISADHGENEGELGIYGDHATADATTCRVPLIIKWPGGGRGVADEAFHYSLDLCPTLIDLLGGESPAIWDGQSFADTVRTGIPVGRDELVLGQCAHVCQRSVRWDRWIYIRTYHDGFRAFPDQMLFDLTADPHEQIDLAPARPDTCQEGLARLTRWHEEQMRKLAIDAAATGGDAEDPLDRVIREGGPWHASMRNRGPIWLVGYLRMLEQTERGESAALLRTRYRQWL
jgi:arylsulfatase A-like enzyme